MKMFPFVALALACGACSLHRAPSLPRSIPAVAGRPRDQFALRSIDFVQGTGAPVVARKCLYAHYTGWLTNGTKFDSSRDTLPNGAKASPISFPQGYRRVIVGWDLGFDGMRVGGRRRLFIPYQLAYGESARGPVIPAKADLIFDVELMAVADTLPRADAAPRGQASPPQCPPWDSVKPGA
jgi:peptidylprolyl isomerase